MAMGKRRAWDRLKMDEKLAWVESMARDGLLEKEIAARIGVSIRTFHRWKKDHPEFQEALDRGKEVPDALVEKSLFQAALGYEYEEEHVTPTGKVVRVRRYQPPNTTAMIYWLKNRRPDKWRDRQEIEHSGQIGVEFDAKEELYRRLERLAERKKETGD